MMSSYNDDDAGIEKRCVVCDSPTQSHPAPNGYLCHTCLTEHDEDEIFEHLGGVADPELSAASVFPCGCCGSIHTLHEATAGGGDFVRIIIGRVPFDSLTAEIVVSCPQCTKATEYLTSETAGENIAEETGTKVYDFTRRGRLVER